MWNYNFPYTANYYFTIDCDPGYSLEIDNPEYFIYDAAKYITFSVTPTYECNNEVTYSTVAAYSWLTFDESGYFTIYTEDLKEAGVYVITVWATDSEDYKRLKNVVVFIRDPCKDAILETSIELK